MKKRARKAITTRTRFEIFKRDGFRCVYCGATPAQTVLHVDHVVAVASGGVNEPENLVTSCQGCNLGKSNVPLDEVRVGSADDRAAADAKERAAQLRAYLRAQREIAKAREAIVQDVIDYWAERVPGWGAREHQIAEWRNAVGRAVSSLPMEQVIDAVNITAWKASTAGMRTHIAQLRYFCAVVRNMIRERGQ